VSVVTARGGRVQTYLDILVRQRWVIIGTALVTVMVFTAGTFLVPPTYSASTTLRVAQAHSGSIDYVDYTYAERLMNTYVEILRSRPMLEEAIRRLGLEMTPQDLAAAVRAQVLADTELIRISAGDRNPWRARDIANTLAGLIVEQSQSLYSGGSKSGQEILQEQLEAIESDLAQDRERLRELTNTEDSSEARVEALEKRISLQEETYLMFLGEYDKARLDEAMRANSISVIEAAIAPENPSRPNKRLNILLGALVGIGGGIGLALVFDNLKIPRWARRSSLSQKGRPGQ
jgi:capsular polysaccharide biosynthesis protein